MTVRDYDLLLIEDAKNHPTISNGMMVFVFDDIEHQDCVGMGMITETWWSDFLFQHCAHIEMFDHTFRDAVPAEYI